MNMDASQAPDVRLHLHVAEYEHMEHRPSSAHDHDSRRSRLSCPRLSPFARTIPASASLSVSHLWRASGGSAKRRIKRKHEENAIGVFQRTCLTAGPHSRSAAMPLAGRGRSIRERFELLARQPGPTFEAILLLVRSRFFPWRKCAPTKAPRPKSDFVVVVPS
jgi:hypothetical protein